MEMDDRTRNDVLNTIRKYLTTIDADGALKTVTANKDNTDILCDIMPILIAQISESVQIDNPSLFECSKKILQCIAVEFEAEAVLLQLIDDIRVAVDDVTFLTLSSVLLTVLLRLPKNRLNSLGWGLNAIHSYVTTITPPGNLDLDDEEALLMDADPAVDRISCLYTSLLPLYDTLIQNLSGDVQERIVVLKFTLQLLAEPLAFLDLRTGKTTSKARRVAEEIVAKIFHLNSNIFTFFELDERCDIGTVNILALATLYYLVLAEYVQVGAVPKVYDNVYIFQRSLQLVRQLLTRNNQFVLHNGLRLMKILIGGVEGRALSYQLLDSEHHSEFCKALVHVIVYNRVEQMRKDALSLYHRYLFVFEAKGRYLLVYNLMAVLNHTGIIGYTITQFKNMFVHELNQSELSPYFTSSNLYRVLDRFCFLHKDEKSDLIELADQIVAALNLLRYLAIRDKSNATGIWDYFKRLDGKYLEPLNKGLSLSRAHYKLKVEEVKDTGVGNSKVSLTVAGELLPAELPPNEQLKCLYSALTTFDVIENLLCRLNELIEMNCK